MKLFFALSILALQLNAATPIPDSCKIGEFVLGCQAYSFNRYTAFEAIDKTKEAGGKTIEFFLWQKFSPEFPNLEVNGDLPDDKTKLLKAKLTSAGIRATSAYFGNTAFTQKDPEAALRKVFEFAKKMDLVALTGEPPESGFDLVEKLCKEYDIRFCLHNHRKDEAKPDYQNWNPEYTMKVIENRDAHMGFCLDTGHLVRSGLKPVDALKILKGRVYSLHLKDPSSADGPDTIFGKGVGDVKKVLQELKKQKFDGFISIEYENNWTNSVPDIKRCIEFVRRGGSILWDKNEVKNY
ncbi:MAG: sugar phosphate isomerase/epimerase [Verrucomicrobiota bacterium]|nr:sugar phosphate isomerase/epimerase [Verrucomicrobiota bacterium]